MATLNINVQSDQVSMTGTTATGTLPTAVVMANTIIFVTYRKDSVRPDDGSLKWELTSTTQISFARVANTGTVEIQWYAAEFSSGVTVDHNNSTSTSTDDDVTISISDMAKSWSMCNYKLSGGSWGHDDAFSHQITSTTVMQIRRIQAAGSGIEVGYQIIEYDNCKVERGIVNVTGTSNTSTSLAVADLDKTFTNCAGEMTTSDSLVEPDEGSFMSRNSTTQLVEISRIGSGPPDFDVGFQRVEFTGSEVVIPVSKSFGTGDVTADVTFGPAIDLDRSVCFLSHIQTGGKSSYSSTDNFGTARCTAELISTTQVRLTRALHGSATLDVICYVVQFEGGGAPPAARTLYSNPVSAMI